MASGTPSAPINSSRGAADTTAGRIYFSTLSARHRIPLTGPHLPPPHFCSHHATRGKLSRGGVKFIRRRKNYPGRAQVTKNSKKNPKIVAQCRKYPIPNLYTLNRTIPYPNTLSRTIPYLYTLNRTIPYLNTLSRIIPYVNTLSRTIPYLITLSRTITYLNTLSRTKPCLNTLSRTIPHLNTLSRKHPILIH